MIDKGVLLSNIDLLTKTQTIGAKLELLRLQEKKVTKARCMAYKNVAECNLSIFSSVK